MNTLSALELIVIGLAIFRITYFVTRENAPFRLMARFRERFPLGGLLDCFYCASVWVTIGVVIGYHVGAYGILQIIAVSAIAAVIYRYAGFDL